MIIAFFVVQYFLVSEKRDTLIPPPNVSIAFFDESRDPKKIMSNFRKIAMPEIYFSLKVYICFL